MKYFCVKKPNNRQLTKKGHLKPQAPFFQYLGNRLNLVVKDY